jgi:hypothetical protein
MRILTALASLFAVPVLLAGCASPRIAGVQPIDGTVSGQCHNEMVRGAVGLAASAATVERARIDSDSEQVQVVRGSATAPVDTRSRDAQPASSGGPRLIIETGANNAITGLRCG